MVSGKPVQQNDVAGPHALLIEEGEEQIPRDMELIILEQRAGVEGVPDDAEIRFCEQGILFGRGRGASQVLAEIKMGTSELNMGTKNTENRTRMTRMRRIFADKGRRTGKQ